MVRLRPIGLIMVLAALSGCVYAYQSFQPAPRYWSGARPDPAYYCYDCHGYRYLDPYYDWCPPNGYRISWDRSPQLMRIYRERYVSLKQKDRRLGRYQYPERYRATRRYREATEYEGNGASKPERRFEDSRREKKNPGRGKSKRAPRDEDDRPRKSRSQRPQGTES